MTYTLIIRSIITYLLVLFLMRLMGKRQIGEMQPFELVITLILADLATIPMADPALPLIHGVIPIITLTFLHFALTYFSRKSLTFRKFLNGKPVIIISPNGINYNSLKKLNMNYNDLIENIRLMGYFNIEEILYAIMQTNGTLTILPRSAFAPLNAHNIKIKVEESSLPIIIINDNKFEKENIKLAKINKEFILTELKNNNIKFKDVTFATIDTNGKMFIQPKDEHFLTIQTNYKGENW